MEEQTIPAVMMRIPTWICFFYFYICCCVEIYYQKRINYIYIFYNYTSTEVDGLARKQSLKKTVFSLSNCTEDAKKKEKKTLSVCVWVGGWVCVHTCMHVRMYVM